MKRLAAALLAGAMLTGCAPAPHKTFKQCVDEETAFLESHYTQKELRAKSAELQVAIYDRCEDYPDK
ncbi:entry exclusion lipoprotein TrbK [Pseudarthrobacter sp. alpha12b]